MKTCRKGALYNSKLFEKPDKRAKAAFKYTHYWQLEIKYNQNQNVLSYYLN